MGKVTLLQNPGLAPLLLRGALALVFVYAAISSLTNPNEWIGYLPEFVTRQLDGYMLLKIFAVYELVLAAWLLSGVWTCYAALACALTLFGITVSNLILLPISFRDVGLGLAALALAVLSYQHPDQPRSK